MLLALFWTKAVKYSVNFLTGKQGIYSLLSGQITYKRPFIAGEILDESSYSWNHSLKRCYNGFLVSALEKTPNLASQDEQPAEVAGIFLESVPIHPPNLIMSGIARVNELIKMHGEVRQDMVYEGDELNRKPVSIAVYKI
jgi:hypothetical protein